MAEGNEIFLKIYSLIIDKINKLGARARLQERHGAGGRRPLRTILSTESQLRFGGTVRPQNRVGLDVSFLTKFI